MQKCSRVYRIRMFVIPSVSNTSINLHQSVSRVILFCAYVATPITNMKYPTKAGLFFASNA